MWILMLNDMRSSKAGHLKAVAKSETKEKLEIFIQSELVDPYREDGWYKYFRRGGLLEWCNPPTYDDEAFCAVEPIEEIIKKTTESYNAKLKSIPTI